MPHFPRRAGNYVLFAELGSGAVGTTYIGRAIGQGRSGFKPLVLRLLDSHLSQRPEVVRVFLDEQRAAALLQHPRIAAVQEVGLLPDGSYFVALEYFHGVPLREVQRSIQAQLTLGQALHVATQLCDALHYAHERLDLTGRRLNIVHAQLSPDSVIVGFDGNVKIIEFGLLRTKDAASVTIPTLIQRRMAFLSPELRAQMPLRSAPSLDRRTDVYSIGALLWEMLTGEHLVPSDDGAPPPPPSSVRPVDPQLDAIVMQAMAKRPDDRFPTAQALRLALSTAQSALHVEGSIATGLARGLTVAFRDRLVAFQEQLDLWRKFEDEAMQDESPRPAPSGISGYSNHGISQTFGVPRRTGNGPASTPQLALTRSEAGRSSSASQSYPNLNTPPSSRSPSGSAYTPPPRSSPSIARSEAERGSSMSAAATRTPQPDGGEGPPSGLRGRLFMGLLVLAILGILVGSTILLLRPRPNGRTATLMVDSQPRGAEIWLDGQVVGKTPYRLTNLPAQQVQIEVRKEGYRVFRRNLNLDGGKTTPLEADLIRDNN